MNLAVKNKNPNDPNVTRQRFKKLMLWSSFPAILTFIFYKHAQTIRINTNYPQVSFWEQEKVRKTNHSLSYFKVKQTDSIKKQPRKIGTVFVKIVVERDIQSLPVGGLNPQTVSRLCFPQTHPFSTRHSFEKKPLFKIRFSWRRKGSLRYPSPKNSPPDCFSRKI